MYFYCGKGKRFSKGKVVAYLVAEESERSLYEGLKSMIFFFKKLSYISFATFVIAYEGLRTNETKRF